MPKDTQQVKSRARNGTQAWGGPGPELLTPMLYGLLGKCTPFLSACRDSDQPLSPLLVAGCSLPPPPLDGEDTLPDLDLLPPPPPSPDEQLPASMGASLISDLEQLHLPPPPPPPQVWVPPSLWSPRVPREGDGESAPFRDLSFGGCSCLRVVPLQYF